MMIKVRGAGLFPGIIQSTVKGFAQDIGSCNKQRLTGVVIVSFTIGLDGSVQNAFIDPETTVKDKPTLDAVIAVFQRIKFPTPTSPVEVIFPMRW